MPCPMDGVTSIALLCLHGKVPEAYWWLGIQTGQANELSSKDFEIAEKNLGF